MNYINFLLLCIGFENVKFTLYTNVTALDNGEYESTTTFRSITNSVTGTNLNHVIATSNLYIIDYLKQINGFNKNARLDLNMTFLFDNDNVVNFTEDLNQIIEGLQR